MTMSKRSLRYGLLASCCLFATSVQMSLVQAQETEGATARAVLVSEEGLEADAGLKGFSIDERKAISIAAIAAKSASGKSKSKYPPYSTVLKDAKKIPGMITLHLKDRSLFAELTPGHLNKDYIVLTTIARGMGQRPLLGGFSWGDDAVWQFRKVDDRIHVVRRNLRFRAKSGSPTARAVKLAYTDSVLFSLPIATKSPSGAYVVNLSQVSMSDLPQISMILRGFMFSPSKSTWADVKSHTRKRRASSCRNLCFRRYVRHRIGRRYTRC